jgi:predicted CoA-binding protein
MSDDLTSQTGWKNPEPAEIEEIIRGSKTIAVVGLSSKTDRDSNRVAKYLMEQGFDIIPVNPRETEILGKKSYPDLMAIGKEIDIVDVFRKGEATPPIVREAIRVGVKNIWLQEGIVSQESYDLAVKAGLNIVMDKCLLVEHRRLE